MEPEEDALSGLTEPKGVGLERIPIRTRESSVTQSGWRLGVEAREGIGTITLVETRAGERHRGDGIFLGWTQEKLAAAYRALAPGNDEPPFEMMQMG